MDESSRLVNLLLGDGGIKTEELTEEGKRRLIRRILEDAKHVLKDLRGVGALETQVRYTTPNVPTTSRIPSELLPKGITPKTRVLRITADHVYFPAFQGEGGGDFPKKVSGKELFLSQDGGMLVQVRYEGELRRGRKLVESKKTPFKEQKTYEDVYYSKYLITGVSVLDIYPDEALDKLFLEYPLIPQYIVWKIYGELVTSEEKAHQLAQRLSRAYMKWETLNQQLRS